jgi:hypothetical protein
MDKRKMKMKMKISEAKIKILMMLMSKELTMITMMLKNQKSLMMNSIVMDH